MRPTAIDLETNRTKRLEHPPDPGDSAPEGARFAYMPKLRCNDCPGKLYTAEPGQVVDAFDVHLRNRTHRQQVEERKRRNRDGR